MKRRFPGDQNGPGANPRFQSRGGMPSFQRAPNPQRGAPGRFPPRGAPGRGFMVGRGQPHPADRIGHRNFGGRGMGRPPMGTFNAPPGRGHMMGPGPIPGRHPMPAGRIPPPRPPNLPPNVAFPRNIPPPPPPPPPRPPIRPPPVRPPPVQPRSHIPPPPFQVTQQYRQNSHAPSVVLHQPTPGPVPPRTLQPSHSSTLQPSHSKPVPIVPQYASGSARFQQGSIPNQSPPAQSNEQIDKAWEEHTAPSGIKYYHNSVTKESTYTKPVAMLTQQPITEAPKTSVRPWKEYEDAATGKKYYSNGVTTTWEKPEGFKSEDDIAKSPEQAEPTKKKRKTIEVKKESEFNNRDEAIAAFKGLMLAKAIAPTLKWNEVAKICASDPRWDACEDALSVGERRQALAEYQTKRANELKTLERQERIRAKEAFGQLLGEVLPSVQGFSALSSRFVDVRTSLSKDDRFYAVQEEDTRESLFLDFCEEFRKREDRKKRNRKREALEAFNSFLNEHEETGVLSFASTWESFLLGLSEAQKADPRFTVSPSMSNSDRQVYFADFVIELQAAEDDKRRRIRDARRRAEKAQRDGYREALRSLAREGKIHPGSRWRSAEEIVTADESFGPVHTQDRNAPREIFEEFLDDWAETYRKDRAFLSQLVHPHSQKVSIVKPNTTYQEFTKILLKEAEHSPGVYGDARRIISRHDPVSSARLFYDDLIVRAKEAVSSGMSRRASTGRPGQLAESSEDEGEIIEEGEVSEDGDYVKGPENGEPKKGDASLKLNEAGVRVSSTSDVKGPETKLSVPPGGSETANSTG